MPGLHGGIVRSQYRRLVGVAALIVLFSVRPVRRVRNCPVSYLSVSHFRLRGCNELADTAAVWSSRIQPQRIMPHHHLCDSDHILSSETNHVCVESAQSAAAPVQVIVHQYAPTRIKHMLVSTWVGTFEVIPE